MKIVITIILLCGLFLVCIVGAAAKICRARRVDGWCSRQLTDGQAGADAGTGE